MPYFRYTILQNNGKTKTYSKLASSKEAIQSDLLSKQLAALNIEEISLLDLNIFNRAQASLKDQDKLLFLNNISQLSKAGLSLPKLLSLLANSSELHSFKSLAKTLLSHVHEGLSFHDALQASSIGLSPSYLALIKAAETSGNLSEILDYIAHDLEQKITLNSKLQSALTYPLIILVIAIVTVYIMLSQVIPEFAPFFEELGDELPFMTRFILAASGLLTQQPWIFPGFLIFSAGTTLAIYKSKKLKNQFTHFSAYIPLIKSVVREKNSITFTRIFGMLLLNGVNLLQAYQLAVDSISNENLKTLLTSKRKEIEQGAQLSNILAPQLSPATVELMRVGEESGELGKMLVNASELGQKKLTERIDLFTKLLVPFTTITLGSFVGLLVAAILSALLNVYQIPA